MRETDHLELAGLAFLMTCPRTAAHEETELLTVLKIPFHGRIPLPTALSEPRREARADDPNASSRANRRDYYTGNGTYFMFPT